MNRGNTALTSRQTLITNLATTPHCITHCFQYLSFLNLCSFERGAVILTLLLENQGVKSSLMATEEKCRDLMTAESLSCSELGPVGDGGQ